ncbi:energy transducer TonB [Occallatibacter savannae]|uniref:energy transducer TonB n=1 Tax=Occallatibacter savannae TaxID=1002691 RepID=UPI000D69EBE8|nr:hypothetical protein [Occallatibacter savannae]
MRKVRQLYLNKAPVRSAGELLCLFSLAFCTAYSQVQASAHDITCDTGSGEYKTEFSGTTVEVGPMRKGSFAERACSARLARKGQELSVADDAGQIGIDVLGADLGFGKPVVAFQVDQTGRGSNVEYRIYSLAKPLRLLQTLSGGDSYTAADTDLDGRIEIWTDDAKAIDGFERIPAVDFDFAPPVVIRFAKGHPVDVGSEFLPYYDELIARLRSQMSQADLTGFKQSDGKLSLKSLGKDAELHRLFRTKISVLELVCAYLYSGRESQAWNALSDYWPLQDLPRMRDAITDLHSRGILRNIEHSRSQPYHRGRAKIYDAVATSPVVSTVNPYGGAPDSSQSEPPVVQPKSILLRRPTSPDGSLPSQNETVELVVDAAGKVRSAKVIKADDPQLVQAAFGWHFIPAFHDGNPVACRFRLSIWALK